MYQAITRLTVTSCLMVIPSVETQLQPQKPVLQQKKKNGASTQENVGHRS